MPGPVEIADPVRRAFHQAPVSHRSDEFVQTFEGVRARLRAMTGAPHVAMMPGSGTLANEVIAGAIEGPGVVLINGEFGARVANQARAWLDDVRTIEWPWGTAWDLDEVERSLDR